MKLGSFYLQMHALVARLIPDIGDEYRAEGCEDSDTPSMTLTVGVNKRGWSYQTGDNSFTGGAYGYADWAVVTLDRECNPHDVAEDIVAQCADFELDMFEPIAPKAHSDALEALRNLVKYRTHGGYVWAAVMGDGETLCTQCARKEYRQIFKATRDGLHDGWAVQGLAHSGESDESADCAHCNKVIWHKWERTEHTVGSHFLSAIINGDYSGLDTAESITLSRWLERFTGGHWSTDEGTTDEFGLCEITGMRGSVEAITYNIIRG